MGYSALPVCEDYEVLKGDSWKFSAELTDDNNAAVSLSGVTPTIEVRADSPTGKLVFTLAVGSGLDVSGNVIAAAKNFTAQTAVKEGFYVAELQLLYADGYKITPLRLNVNVAQDTNRL